MNLVTAFAAVGLTAVSWDDTLSRAGARAFRHALDYREPYCQMTVSYTHLRAHET